MSKIALFCGIPPHCDRCGEDAKVSLKLPIYGERCLCEDCVLTLVERGLGGPVVVVAQDVDHDYAKGM